MASPYMPLYTADFSSDTAHLTNEELGAYMKLVINYWQRKQFLKNIDDCLRYVVGVSKAKWAKLKPVLMRFFQVNGDHWHHKRIDKELEIAAQKSIIARNSAYSRHRKNGGKVVDMHPRQLQIDEPAPTQAVVPQDDPEIVYSDPGPVPDRVYSAQEPLRSEVVDVADFVETVLDQDLVKPCIQITVENPVKTHPVTPEIEDLYQKVSAHIETLNTPNFGHYSYLRTFFPYAIHKGKAENPNLTMQQAFTVIRDSLDIAFAQNKFYPQFIKQTILNRLTEPLKPQEKAKTAQMVPYGTYQERTLYFKNA